MYICTEFTINIWTEVSWQAADLDQTVLKEWFDQNALFAIIVFTKFWD